MPLSLPLLFPCDAEGKGTDTGKVNYKTRCKGKGKGNSKVQRQGVSGKSYNNHIDNNTNKTDNIILSTLINLV